MTFFFFSLLFSVRVPFIYIGCGLYYFQDEASLFARTRILILSVFELFETQTKKGKKMNIATGVIKPYAIITVTSNYTRAASEEKIPTTSWLN